MKCNVLIDWLTFTVKDCYDPYKVISWYLGLDGSLFEPMPYGLNGYDKVLRFNDIMVCYEPRECVDFRNMGVCVSMSGNGCRAFETYSKLSLDGCIDTQGTPNIAFPALFQLICANGCNVSRIDIACDEHDGVLHMDDFAECVRTNSINSRMQKREVVMSYDGIQNSGCTVYLGAESSDFRVRIYDKAKEQGDYQSHWVRVELVLRGKNALAFVDNFVNCDSLGTLAAGIMNDKFLFIERDDENISRCSTCGWWLEFVGSIESIKILSREAVQHDVEEIQDWVIQQVAPSLGILFKAYGYACLNEIIDIGVARMSNKQNSVVKDYLKAKLAEAKDLDERLAARKRWDSMFTSDGQMRLWA